MVVGIGDESVALARAISTNSVSPYQLMGFITKRSDSRRAKLLGKRIYTQKNLEAGNIDETIDGVIIINEIMDAAELAEWTNLSLAQGLLVLKSPNFENFTEPSEGITKIKKLQIEDLLNREQISIENQEVRQRHYNKNILITGGAGSIGSELVRQVSLFNPALIVVLDQAETPLNDIELEMREKFPNVQYKFVLADISNSRRMEQLFEKYRFAMVYHAAAYKHVPIIEENPHEGVLVNIYGTRSLASLSSKYKVNRFVMVSTDKAVNPTNVMGASKRVAELFVQALNDQPDNTTKFITTRFGNVLGSNGSVIPHFTRQIEKGGPVTITHPDIVRYFMTIPEACNLVLQAGTMGSGGEIYVFDMGEPVKIVDLAKRMIKLYGYTPDKEIKIVYTGLRPGEKLYEELLSDNAKTMPTHHDKILISKDARTDFDQICDSVSKITKAALRYDNFAVVTLLKEIVPEFISNNSIYEQLDVK